MLSQLQRPFEVVPTLLEIFLSARYHPQFETSLHLAPRVLHLAGQFEVFLNKQLHLVLVVRKVLSADLTDVSHSHRLTAEVAHLDRVLQCILEIIDTVLLVAQPIVAETEVDTRQKFTIYVC